MAREQLAKFEIRGRITDAEAFEYICRCADIDFGFQPGTAKDVLLQAIKDGKPAIVEGMIKDAYPLRTTDAMKRLKTTALFVVGHDNGYGDTYIVHGTFDQRMMLPMSSEGVAMSAKGIEYAMNNGFPATHMILYHLKKFNPEYHPSCSMPRSLQVELMPDEKISLLAGLKRW